MIGQNNYFGIGLQQSFENHSILCIVIYPLHRTIQPLNNLGQQYSGQYVQIHNLIWTNHTHETKKKHYGNLSIIGNYILSKIFPAKNSFHKVSRHLNFFYFGLTVTDDEPDDEGSPQHYILIHGILTASVILHLSEIGVNVDAIICVKAQNYKSLTPLPAQQDEDKEDDEETAKVCKQLVLKMCSVDVIYNIFYQIIVYILQLLHVFVFTHAIQDRLVSTVIQSTNWFSE